MGKRGGRGRKSEDNYALGEEDSNLDYVLSFKDQALSEPGGLDKTEDLICWARDLSAKEAFADSLKPQPKLSQLLKTFEVRRKRERKTTLCSLNDLENDEVTMRASAKPAGYAATTTIYFGGKGVHALLDSCATCSSIPEEMVILILEHAYEMHDSGEMVEEDRRYPVLEIERYKNAASVLGVEGAGMQIKHGIYLNAELVPQNGKTGEPGNPMVSIYFKVLPKGKANMAGILIGNPTLDKGPQGLGWEVHDTTHFFSQVNKHLPRRELSRKSCQFDEVRDWNAEVEGQRAKGTSCQVYAATESVNI